MVIGVKVLSSKHFKGYCRSCNKTLKNGQEVAYIQDTKRSHHIGCDWRGSKLAVQLKTGAGLHIESNVPVERHRYIRSRFARAVEEARLSLEEDLQRQLMWKQTLLTEYPIGARLIHTYDETRIRFVEVVSYSALGNSVRLREVAKISVDTWVTERMQYVDWASRRRELIREFHVLCKALWSERTAAYHNVNTMHFGGCLVMGHTGRMPYDYAPHAVAEVEGVQPDGTQLVANVRSLAGRLWLSVVLSPELDSVLQLQKRVADAIGLLPMRGRVVLTYQGNELYGNLSRLTQTVGTTLDLTAVVKEETAWPVALDGRPMPYARFHRICGESLAFDTYTVRVRESDSGLGRRV